MRNRMNIIGAIAIAIFGLCGSISAETEVNIQSLLDEMVHRENVARWPQPAYTCKHGYAWCRPDLFEAPFLEVRFAVQGISKRAFAKEMLFIETVQTNKKGSR